MTPDSAQWADSKRDSTSGSESATGTSARCGFACHLTTMAGNAILQVASFTLPPTRLGFLSAQLFRDVMHRTSKVRELEIYSRAGNETSAATYESVIHTDSSDG